MADISIDHEKRMKALLLQALRRRGLLRTGDIVSSEFVVAGQGRRADLAFYGRSFTGVEVKSERDTLHRLTQQLDAYQKCFDRVILALAPKHIEKALALVPESVSIWLIDTDGRVAEVRKARSRPALQVRDLLRALTLDEARKAYPNASPEDPRYAEGSNVTLRSARSALSTAFSERFAKTSNAFWREVEDRCVEPAHLATLSRFADRRRAHAEAQQSRRDFWLNWHDEARSVFGAYAADPV